MTKTPTPPKMTKISTVRQMLELGDGASLGEICAATGWQKHSARAALTGLRKTGLAIARQDPKEPGGPARYRTAPTAEAGA